MRSACTLLTYGASSFDRRKVDWYARDMADLVREFGAIASTRERFGSNPSLLYFCDHPCDLAWRVLRIGGLDAVLLSAIIHLSLRRKRSQDE
jgi:hypothetical protein